MILHPYFNDDPLPVPLPESYEAVQHVQKTKVIDRRVGERPGHRKGGGTFRKVKLWFWKKD